jgi:hypothetical protein
MTEPLLAKKKKLEHVLLDIEDALTKAQSTQNSAVVQGYKDIHKAKIEELFELNADISALNEKSLGASGDKTALATNPNRQTVQPTQAFKSVIALAKPLSSYGFFRFKDGKVLDVEKDVVQITSASSSQFCGLCGKDCKNAGGRQQHEAHYCPKKQPKVVVTELKASLQDRPFPKFG